MDLITLAVILAGCLMTSPVVVATQPVARRPIALMPRDEAALLPGFFSFRAQLIAAIARRDAAALMAVVDSDIKNGFGGDDGKAAFEREWKPSAPDSRVWEVLATVLALGGSRAGDEGFIAPYIHSSWPNGVDGFEHVAVIGERVRVRRAPSADAEEIAHVSFEVLARGKDDKAPEDWTSVTLSNGQSGYISSRFVRSPIDYRAFFSRKEGRWWMVMLLAGD